jgi:hypothetical protein
MLVMLRGVLAMHGVPVPPKTVDLLEAVGRRLGLDVAPVGEVAAHRPDKRWACPAAQFMAYLAAVATVADHVDRFDTGEPR